MLSNFTIRNNRIVLKNDGEYFGALHDFEYPIGDKLYEFAIMSYEDFDKLKKLYTDIISKHLEQIYYLNLKLVFLLKIQNILQKSFMNK